MARIWKEVLCLGRQCDRYGRWFDITPRKVTEARRNAALMLSRGVPVPAIWEHQSDIEANKIPAAPDAEAEWKRRYARFCFGHIVGERVNARGNLELLHDVPDERDVAQLLKTRYVSPKVYPSYSDSRGGTYRGTTIAHVAATPTPVQFWQRPFELSQGGALYLSYTPPEGSTVPDDKGDDKKGKTSTGGDLAALIDALREKGHTIPDEVTDIGGLIIAIKAGKDTGAGGDDLDADMGLDDGMGAGDTAAAGNAPMLMSMTDPRAAGWVADERKDTLRRIKRLFQTGRVDRPTARRLQRQAQAVEMSFTADAEAVSPLHRALVELEKRAADSVWKSGALDLSATRVGADRPAHLEAQGAPDPDVIKRQEELAARMSVAPRK